VHPDRPAQIPGGHLRERHPNSRNGRVIRRTVAQASSAATRAKLTSIVAQAR
jgi:hypothetical protein